METTIEVPLSPSLTNTPQGVAAPANTLVNDLFGALVSNISKAVIEQLQDSIAQHVTVAIENRYDYDFILHGSIDRYLANKNIGIEPDQLHELIEKYMSSRYDHFLDGHIGRWMENNFDINEYESDLDIDDKIDSWMSNNFDITDHAGDLEIEDKVRDAVNNLEFEVRVS